MTRIKSASASSLVSLVIAILFLLLLFLLKVLILTGEDHSSCAFSLGTGSVWFFKPTGLNSNKGSKTLTGVFASFYARRTFGNSAAPTIRACLVSQFWLASQLAQQSPLLMCLRR